MSNYKALSLGLFLLLLIPTSIYWWVTYSFSPFLYTEVDDFYSYISIDDSAGERRKMVVPFGVFSVEKEGRWLHVARMDVSIIECQPVNGKANEGTLYRDRLEYWTLNISDGAVYGPMNKAENSQFLTDNTLKGVIIKPPKSYDNYLNDLNLACNKK
tara:strand:+ start:39 stop:509 length:471 start_codon:yes stop_codon:yes gene_type:complete